MNLALSDREKELIQGMIEVQLDHAERCDRIQNRDMAAKQKNWDLERVELLRKIKTVIYELSIYYANNKNLERI